MTKKKIRRRRCERDFISSNAGRSLISSGSLRSRRVAPCCAHNMLSPLVALLAQTPPSSPPGCYCGWTLQHACPTSSTPGTSWENGGYARDDGSECFKFCCPYPPSAPPPAPPPPLPPPLPPATPPPSSPPYSCDCGWTTRHACPTSPTGGSAWQNGGYARDDGSECFKFCCPPAPSAPPEPPAPPASPSPPMAPPCERCDAGAECGYCLVLVPDCPFWPMITKPKCGPDMPVGEWCEGDGSCGTDDQANSCFFWEEIYTRLDCSLTPSPPPPPLDPRPPAGPGESAFLPAPPPPANGVLGQGAADDGDNGFFGPISLAWFIVILVWALLTPVLLCVLCYYARLKGWCCFAGLSLSPSPSPSPSSSPHPSTSNLCRPCGR